MQYRRMPIEAESPEELGYETIQFNLAESSVSDRKAADFLTDIGDLLLCYGEHRGRKEFRELIASESPGITADDVLITPSAATALFIIHTSLLKKGDKLIVSFPNYATNLETPYAIGADIIKAELRIENKFRFDIQDLIQRVSGSTRLVSVTHPHNPTGVNLTSDDFMRLKNIAHEGIPVLVDETYRELNYSKNLSYAASLHENMISVSSMSKAFGIPGVRIGWIICRNKMLMEKFLAAKEQIIISNSVIDEEIAFRAYREKERLLRDVLIECRRNRDIVSNWLNEEKRLTCVIPEGGVICFPKINVNFDEAKFYRILYHEYKTMVGPGHWFGFDDSYFRLGFGWTNEKDLLQGLKNITAALDNSTIP